MNKTGNSYSTISISVASVCVLALMLLVAYVIHGAPILQKALGQEPTMVTIANKTLDEPFYTEEGKIDGQYTYSANGTLKGVGNITNNGVILMVPLSAEAMYGQGQGVLSTADGSEEATYMFQFISKQQNVSGNSLSHGSWYLYTNSTGTFAFLNNMVGITESEIDQNGQFTTKVWEWK